VARGVSRQQGLLWLFAAVLASPVMILTFFGASDGRRGSGPALAKEEIPRLASETAFAPNSEPVALSEEDACASMYTDLSSVKLAAVIVSLNSFAMSYGTCVIGAAMLRIKRDVLFAPMDSFTVGAVVSVTLVAAAVGSLCAPAVADRSGRRRASQTIAVLMLVGCCLMASAQSVLQLATGRAVQGFGVGLSACGVNLYIAEIAPAEVRGKLGAYAPLFGQSGVLFAFLVPSLSIPLGDWAWRAMLGFAALPAVGVLLFSGLVPETPRWLLSKGRRGEAATSLARLYPNAPPRALQVELAALTEEVGASRGDEQSLWKLVWEHGQAVRAGVLLNVLQQVTGINVILYFGPQVLKLAGFSDEQALVFLTAMTGVLVGVVLGFAAVVDSWGRRTLAIGGCVAVMLGLCLLAAAFHLRDAGANGLSTALAVLGIVEFRMAFSFTLAPLPYVMSAELFPQEVRAMGAGVSMMSNWLANFVVCQSFPMILDGLAASAGQNAAASLVFCGYVVLTGVALLFVIKMLPETAGARLDAPKA